MMYLLDGPDNNSYMCCSEDTVHAGMKGIVTCIGCGYRTNFDYINRKFKVNRRVYDVSYTYDGYCIVSRKFKEIVDRYDIDGAIFQPLENDKDFFSLTSMQIIEFDYKKRVTRFEKKCNVCGNYESVIGATPAYFKSDIKHDICRSDLKFGSGNAKSPLLLISNKTLKVFLKEKMKGLDAQLVES